MILNEVPVPNAVLVKIPNTEILLRQKEEAWPPLVHLRQEPWLTIKIAYTKVESYFQLKKQVPLRGNYYSIKEW